MCENDYKEQTPEDLYRCGKQTHPNLDHIRTPEMVKKNLCKKSDIKTFEKDNNIYVKKLSGGVSVFNGICETFKSKWWWRIPKDTEIPVGLVVTQDINSNSPISHYLIQSLNDITITDYKRLLKKLGETARRR